MAPAGTAFKRPFGTKPAPRPQVPISLSDDDDEDDGPRYRGGSSDDEHARRANDIRPTKFGRSEEKVEESPVKEGNSRFKEILSTSAYKPGVARASGPAASFTGSAFDSRNRDGGASTSTLVTGRKPGGDIMANAYGSASRKPRQMGPSRAQPVVINDDDDVPQRVSDIQDWLVRERVKHIKQILPTKPVSEIYKALKLKNMNADDAMDYLASQEEATEKPATPNRNQAVDLTGSDDELMPTPVAQKTKPSFAQRPSIQDKWGTKKGPSIQDKWSSTQTVAKPVPKPVTIPSSPPAQPQKQFKRLVRGRKRTPSPEPATIQRREDSGEESDVASDAESDRGDFDSRLLKFFNTCTVADLIDTASIDKDTAEYIVSKRSFKSLDAIRSIPPKIVKSTKSRTKPKPIGEKIVDTCDAMFTGYEAVDDIVAKCEALGRPLAKDMKEWGIDVFGAKNGEVELVNFGESQHDSGIGTPQSDYDENRGRKPRFIPQPELMNTDFKMKDYQVVGVNWLSLLYRHNLSCILADDMGLGKTCQVIAFLAHLLETGETGPHLVVVPASTLENWLKEFRKFCPALVVEPLYGTEKERFEIRDRIEQGRDSINVVVTTQHTAKAKDDSHWLRTFGFTCCIYDEAHFLRNATSQVYEKLNRFKSKFRLLLTGTPLQNNLQELMSLLGFILPSVFKDKKEELQSIFSQKAKTGEESHDALLSKQRIARARSMLTPFILRRKKHQVLKDIPIKIRRVEYCEMSPGQNEIYASWLEHARRIAAERADGKMSNENANVLMKLRQAAIHELLFHRIYDKPALLKKIAKTCLKDPMWAESNPDLIFEELVAYSDLETHQLCIKSPPLRQFALQNEEWLDSGKVQKMVELLTRFRSEGSRTLIFSQFTMVLDILELVMNSLDTRYLRLDGSTPVTLRQELIDEFNSEDIPVFMLSTKAGGAGINLATANKIIIFDSSFNPQDDIQAENRAHRIGQTREVEVVRLISRNSIEEQIHRLGETKLALDDMVAGADVASTGTKQGEEQVEGETGGKEKEGMAAVEDLLFGSLVGGGEKKEGVKKEKEDVKREAKETKVEEVKGEA